MQLTPEKLRQAEDIMAKNFLLGLQDFEKGGYILAETPGGWASANYQIGQELQTVMRFPKERVADRQFVTSLIRNSGALLAKVELKTALSSFAKSLPLTSEAMREFLRGREAPQAKPA